MTKRLLTLSTQGTPRQVPPVGADASGRVHSAPWVSAGVTERLAASTSAGRRRRRRRPDRGSRRPARWVRPDRGRRRRGGRRRSRAPLALAVRPRHPRGLRPGRGPGERRPRCRTHPPTSSRSSTRRMPSPTLTVASTSSAPTVRRHCPPSCGCTAGPSCRGRRATSPTTCACSPGAASPSWAWTTRSPRASATPRRCARSPPPSPTSSTTPTGSASTPGGIVLAGDSAGAQIAAQVASLVTDPDYAARVGIARRPAPREPARRRALLRRLRLRAVARAARGSARGSSTPRCGPTSAPATTAPTPPAALASVPQNLPAAFPPAFVAAGNADPLLAHSLALTTALDAVGVEHETLFFGADDEPRLGHEFQFDLDTEAGRLALDRTVAFVERVTGSAPAFVAAGNADPLPGALARPGDRARPRRGRATSPLFFRGRPRAAAGSRVQFDLDTEAGRRRPRPRRRRSWSACTG